MKFKSTSTQISGTTCVTNHSLSPVTLVIIKNDEAGKKNAQDYF
jgi:hypothetical protein